jgi:hypothetical protein
MTPRASETSLPRSASRCARLKEARLRLRVMQSAGYLDPSDGWLIEEARELTKILAAIIRTRTRT